MAKTAYNIQLKGYVRGADFDRKAVDNLLAAQSGKTVNVLIDSLGGSLATGLSISAAFKNHGNVNVHSSPDLCSQYLARPPRLVKFSHPLMVTR